MTFFPQLAELSQRPGKLRLLFDMIGFEGWDAGALWDEIKFDLKHAWLQRGCGVMRVWPLVRG